MTAVTTRPITDPDFTTENTRPYRRYFPARTVPFLPRSPIDRADVSRTHGDRLAVARPFRPRHRRSPRAVSRPLGRRDGSGRTVPALGAPYDASGDLRVRRSHRTRVGQPWTGDLRHPSPGGRTPRGGGRRQRHPQVRLAPSDRQARALGFESPSGDGVTRTNGRRRYSGSRSTSWTSNSSRSHTTSITRTHGGRSGGSSIVSTASATGC